MNVNKDPVIIIKQRYHKEVITGSRRISNYFWVIVLGFGGIGFSLSGLSSYFKINLLPFIDIADLIFIPQGILMLFYGTLSTVVSIFLLLSIIWDVGGGYNEYNFEFSLVRIVRKGFPGPNRRVSLIYPFEDISTIELEVTEGLNSSRNIFICLKDNRRIPITSVEQPRTLAVIEKQASDLANLLDVNLTFKR